MAAFTLCQRPPPLQAHPSYCCGGSVSLVGIPDGRHGRILWVFSETPLKGTEDYRKYKRTQNNVIVIFRHNKTKTKNPAYLKSTKVPIRDPIISFFILIIRTTYNIGAFYRKGVTCSDESTETLQFTSPPWSLVVCCSHSPLTGTLLFRSSSSSSLLLYVQSTWQ